MNDTKENIINNVTQLSSYATTLSLAPAKQVLRLRDELLALPNETKWTLGGKSGLNSDGSPLQYCISSSNSGLQGRFISDPSCIIGPPKERYQYSYLALQKLYKKTGSDDIKKICEEMLAYHLPKEQEVLEEYPDGVFWLGASPDRSGMAVYIDGRRGGHDASWERLRGWMTDLMPNNTEVDSFIDSVKPFADIMSIGLEGSNFENLRAKIYFRLSKPTSLMDLDIPLLKEDKFTAFLNDVVGDNKIRLSGLVFNIGFHIASSKMFDAKIDVCGCNSCVKLNSKEWIALLNKTTLTNDVKPFPVDDSVLDNQCAVSYYGIGVDRKGNVRINLYLKNKLPRQDD
ncbi:hypothetical protein [uncultured Aquimarina sp.]|uniref:hypothetical protein n=1 Tax=uncultured Aquimarina sp. TaxID=575652 RepID=UPI002613C1F8|nr:hypothetical protein [uncultured Aquimarina sp.]